VSVKRKGYHPKKRVTMQRRKHPMKGTVVIESLPQAFEIIKEVKNPVLLHGVSRVSFS
jgi:hypothetical protein